MEVSYTMSLEDHLAFNLHVQKHTPSVRRQCFVLWLVPPLVVLIAAVLVVENQPWKTFYLVISCALYALIFPIFHRVACRRQIRSFLRDHDDSGKTGRITLTLSDDTLTERTSLHQSVVRWQDTRGVEVVGDTTYIFITGRMAFVLPRHGFERPEEYEAAQKFALAKLTKS